MADEKSRVCYLNKTVAFFALVCFGGDIEQTNKNLFVFRPCRFKLRDCNYSQACLGTFDYFCIRQFDSKQFSSTGFRVYFRQQQMKIRNAVRDFSPILFRSILGIPVAKIFRAHQPFS